MGLSLSLSLLCVPPHRLLPTLVPSYTNPGVSITSSLPAIRQLEGIVRMKLIDEDVASKEEERVRNLQSGQSGQGGQGGKAML